MPSLTALSRSRAVLISGSIQGRCTFYFLISSEIPGFCWLVAAIIVENLSETWHPLSLVWDR